MDANKGKISRRSLLATAAAAAAVAAAPGPLKAEQKTEPGYLDLTDVIAEDPGTPEKRAGQVRHHRQRRWLDE